MTSELNSSSSLRVPYNLRPAKQTERRMLLDLYQRLMEIGFPISDYHYLGFGSIFFVDFRILHKILHVDRMTSIEGYAGLWDRCLNNRPFSNVNLFKGVSTDLISGLTNDEFYLAWFDYDFPVNAIVEADISGLCAKLRPWSLLFFTVDLGKAKEMADEKPSTLFQYFTKELPQYVLSGLTTHDFRLSVRERTITQMVERCVKRGLRGRKDIIFEYLIRLTYADGHRMLTIGGMLADGSARRKLSGAALSDLWFLSRGQAGPTVDIPRFVFTPKEVALLEQSFPGSVPLPKNLGIEASEVEAFRRFYRYWPSYAEMFV